MRFFRMTTMLSLLAVVNAGCLHTTVDAEVPDAGATADAGLPSASLELSPASLTVPLGASAPFRVTQVQPDGVVVDVTATAEVRAEPEGVVTLTPGALRAVAPGAVTLVAKLGSLEARAAVTVPAASVRSLEVTVVEPSVAKGALFTATAMATLTDGALLDVSSSAQWSVENPQDVEQVLRLFSAGLVLAQAPGQARVRATVGAVTAWVDVVVRDARVVSLLVSPGMGAVPVGGSLQLAAVARYSDGTEADVTRAATWSSSAPTFTVDASGLAVARSSGAASLSAAYEGQNASSALTATEATARQLVFMPGSLTLGLRASAPLRLVATFSDGTSADVTSQASFVSSRPAVASVSTSGVRGVVTALAAGSADITGRFGAVSATAPVVVTAAAVQSLELTPRSVVIAGNGVVSVRARATYTDGSQSDVSEQAVWTSADVAIATVSNAAGAKGQVRGAGGGATVVTAQLRGVSATLDVTVQAATLSSLELTPAMTSLDAGRTAQLRAFAWFSDNTMRDVTQQAAWSSLTPDVATVSTAVGSRGLVRALANGTATIRVTHLGQTATATVRVQPPTLMQLAINPGAMSVPLGLPAGFEATAAYSDGSAVPVSDQVVWSSSNPQVAEVLLSQGYAYLDSKQPGTVVITATLAGVAPATATVTITSATLSRIDVSPARPMLPVGAYVELNASGVYSDLTTQYLRYAASWTSSNPSVATVGNGYQDKGWVQALRPGTTTITATFNGVSSTTVLTVTSATLQQLQVTPFAPRLPVGFDTALRATGLYSDNTTRDLTNFVSWTSSAPATASVGSWAAVQPLQPGTATITATYGGVQGTTVVTVTSATLTSLAITAPATTPLGVQATRRLSATGTFSDGSTMDVTPYVTWLSSAADVASVSNAWPTQGEVKGLSAGQASVTAVRAGVTAATPIVVQ